MQNRYDIFFIGGGQDFEQEVLLKDLGTGKAAEIRAAVEDEKTFLAICGGYQMLGQYYKTWDGVQLDFYRRDQHSYRWIKRAYDWQLYV